jgi:peroxiredoxin
MPDDARTTDDARRSGWVGRRRSLIRFGVLLAGLVAVAFVVLNPGGSGVSNGSTELGAFSLRTVDGGEITLADFDGTPLVVNYFAAWCPPCRAELPAFEKVSREVATDGVLFIGISRDNDETSWKSFIAETDVTYQTVFEGLVGGSFEAVAAKGMPTTVFVRADGSVAEVFSGALPEDTLRAKIDEFLLGRS